MTEDTDQNSAVLRLIEQSHSSSVSDRIDAAVALGAAAQDTRAWTRLTEMLDDPDTAVIESATESAVRARPDHGIRAAVAAMAVSTDNAGYHIRDAVVQLSHEGIRVRELLDVMRGEPLPAHVLASVVELQNMVA